jgi:hypothetical protein
MANSKNIKRDRNYRRTSRDGGLCTYVTTSKYKWVRGKKGKVNFK